MSFIPTGIGIGTGGPGEPWAPQNFKVYFGPLTISINALATELVS